MSAQVVITDPKCPVCGFLIKPEHLRFHVTQVIDNMPVSVPIHRECQSGIEHLDKTQYIIPQPDNDERRLRFDRHWSDEPQLWAVGA